MQKTAICIALQIWCAMMIVHVPWWICPLLAILDHVWWTQLDLDDGHFFSMMGWWCYFLRHHCHRWVFNGLTIPGPSTLNVFLQINNWNWWFFYGFPKFRCNSQRWFWPWQRPENAHNHDISPFATTVLIFFPDHITSRKV